jgi:hypothetical protein
MTFLPSSLRAAPHFLWRTRKLLAARAALAAFSLAAISSVAPPPGMTHSQEIHAYDVAHAQKLDVSKTVAVTDLKRDTYAATDGYQTFINGGTNYDWAKLVLLDGGWPVSNNNVTVFLRWMRQENGANDWWNRDNPLNNGYGSGGGAGTGSYANLVVAAQKCAEALHKGIGGGYGGIVSALAANKSPRDTASAIWASGWSTSHYMNGKHWSEAPVEQVKAPAGAW